MVGLAALAPTRLKSAGRAQPDSATLGLSQSLSVSGLLERSRTRTQCVFIDEDTVDRNAYLLAQEAVKRELTSKKKVTFTAIARRLGTKLDHDSISSLVNGGMLVKHVMPSNS